MITLPGETLEMIILIRIESLLCYRAKTRQPFNGHQS